MQNIYRFSQSKYFGIVIGTGPTQPFTGEQAPLNRFNPMTRLFLQLNPTGLI